MDIENDVENLEEQKTPEETKVQVSPKTDYLLPLSIVIAAVLIAGSWIYSTGLKYQALNNQPNGLAQVSGIAPDGNTITEQAAAKAAPGNENTPTAKTTAVSGHTRGNLSAPVKIIEYSDLECPFCKIFHQTMIQVMNEYGQSGKVLWVYKHYPLESLHPVKSRKASIASECAAEQGGNGKFWSYIDKYYETTPSNNQIDLAELPKIAASIGLDVNKFNTCLESGKYDQLVKDNSNEAEKAGAQGTPFSIVISKNGKNAEIPGALPFEQVKLIIEEALK